MQRISLSLVLASVTFFGCADPSVSTRPPLSQVEVPPNSNLSQEERDELEAAQKLADELVKPNQEEELKKLLEETEKKDDDS